MGMSFSSIYTSSKILYHLYKGVNKLLGRRKTSSDDEDGVLPPPVVWISGSDFIIHIGEDKYMVVSDKMSLYDCLTYDVTPIYGSLIPTPTGESQLIVNLDLGDRYEAFMMIKPHRLANGEWRWGRPQSQGNAFTEDSFAELTVSKAS